MDTSEPDPNTHPVITGVDEDVEVPDANVSTLSCSYNNTTLTRPKQDDDDDEPVDPKKPIWTLTDSESTQKQDEASDIATSRLAQASDKFCKALQAEDMFLRDAINVVSETIEHIMLYTEKAGPYLAYRIQELKNERLKNGEGATNYASFKAGMSAMLKGLSSTWATLSAAAGDHISLSLKGVQGDIAAMANVALRCELQDHGLVVKQLEEHSRVLNALPAQMAELQSKVTGFQNLLKVTCQEDACISILSSAGAPWHVVWIGGLQGQGPPSPTC